MLKFGNQKRFGNIFQFLICWYIYDKSKETMKSVSDEVAEILKLFVALELHAVSQPVAPLNWFKNFNWTLEFYIAQSVFSEENESLQ